MPKPSLEPLPWFPDAELESDLASIPIHLLVATADDGARQTIIQTLSPFGYRITIAEDGRTAWRALLDLDDIPKLAILDWTLPCVEGIELCRRLRMRGNPFVYAIMLTERDSDNDIVAALEAGAQEFVSTPFNPYVLAARVAAGARIVRLEQKLTMKSEILKEYAEKLERVSHERLTKI